MSRELAVDQRRQKFISALEGAARSFMAAATALKEMDEAGDDVSWVGTKTLFWLRGVYQGRVIPQLAEMRGSVLANKLASLPIKEQSRLMNGDAVSVLVMRGGAADELKMHVADLEPNQVKQVFADGCIRTLAQQRAYIEERSLREQFRKSSVDEVRVDRKRKGICVGARFIDFKELTRLVASLSE